MRPRLLAALLLPLGGAAAGQPALHPHLPGIRPFHARLAEAQVVALVRAERIDEGRIAVRLEEALLGAPPDRFEVKRSPLAPPPLATGDRALLLLRGDRPPYVLADRPSEVIRLGDDAMAARWRAAARAALAARGDPAALGRVYEEWIATGPASLRELGMAGRDALAREGSRLRGTSRASDGAARFGIAE
jgi:hypothetical protein